MPKAHVIDPTPKDQKAPLYEYLFQKDFIQPIIEQLARGGWYINKHTQKLNRLAGEDWDNDFILIKRPKETNCELWHRVLFDRYNLLPEYCRTRCYKIVVPIPTFGWTMAFYQLMEEWDLDSKVGIEKRPYVPRNYSAYFYAQSMLQGREIYAHVLDLIDKDLPNASGFFRVLKANDWEVHLKRACTEFEFTFGPTDKWEPISKEEKEHQDEILDLYDFDYVRTLQPDYLRRHIVRKWMEFAFERGDHSYLPYNDGKLLMRGPVTYHKGAIVVPEPVPTGDPITTNKSAGYQADKVRG